MAKPKKTVEQLTEEELPPRSKARELFPIVDMRKGTQVMAKDFRPQSLDEVAEPEDVELLILEEQLEVGIDGDELAARRAEGEAERPKGKETASS
jgi:hypothetical protein